MTYSGKSISRKYINLEFLETTKETNVFNQFQNLERIVLKNMDLEII